MSAFITAPRRIPLFLRVGLWVAERTAGQRLLGPRLLSWYPRAAIGSGILESLVAHHDGRVTERMLKLVRLAVSFAVECPFCMGMNANGWEKLISEDELAAVQGRRPLDDVPSLTPGERLAVEYARLASATPLAFPHGYGELLRASFTEREIVVLATTAAQVNYWARALQALGAPAAG